MREIKFRIHHRGIVYDIETRLPKFMRSKRYKGWYKCQGYIMRLVSYHPYMNKRGYVPEHRLIIEEKLGRFLEPNEFVHHIDQNRSNNDLSNLRLEGGQNLHAKGHLRGNRNPHGQFVCKEPIFNDIKFRLKDTNTGLTTIYTLNQLIATTFRRGQFEFRGRWTGLKDKNGKEIYEGDILKRQCGANGIKILPVVFKYDRFTLIQQIPEFGEHNTFISGTEEIIGNIYENGDLLEDKPLSK